MASSSNANTDTASNNNNNSAWCDMYFSILNAHNDRVGGGGGGGRVGAAIGSSSSNNNNSLFPTPNISSNFNNFYDYNCSDQPPTLTAPIVTTSLMLYTYSVPVVLAIGILGNLVSLRVFLSRSMRKLSASTYLAALSTADIAALIFYVLVEWLRLGFPHLNDNKDLDFLNSAGMCHALFYLSYISRFLSAWFIVTFTVERYIGVCHPLKRKDICGSRSAQKVLGILVVFSLVVMMFKPILTDSREVQTMNSKVTRCLPNPEHPTLSFVLDSVYGLSITVVPFLLISVLNTLIIRRLMLRYKRHKRCNVITEESIIRMEFTVILLVVSFVFIVLNLPYCFVWCKRFFLSRGDMHGRPGDSDLGQDFDNYEGVLMITRVVFYMNYCVNFFLYSVTGAYFRKELKILVFYKNQYSEVVLMNCSRNGNSSPTTPQSWV